MPEDNYTRWRKSSRSGGNNGNCVEVGFAPGKTGIRDTKDRTYSTLEVSRDTWATFLAAVKRDDLTG